MVVGAQILKVLLFMSMDRMVLVTVAALTLQEVMVQPVVQTTLEVVIEMQS